MEPEHRWRRVLDLLQCAGCAATFAAPIDSVDAPLQCTGCGVVVPIRAGIPRFVTGDDYVSSFGRQWTTYDVAHQAEDDATFQVKSGVALGELAGLRVLDAGCGGGRYSHVVARHGGHVVSVDLSRAVDRTAELCRSFSDAVQLQADLNRLPLRPETFDLVFSIGVLHHSPDPRGAFRAIARRVRVGGRLAVWLYRRNTWLQERVNDFARGVARRMTFTQLERAARFGALFGSVPVVNRTLNKLVNFSNHPVWENRVCDNFDWYSPRYQSHHTIAELGEWFRDAGFESLRELPPEKDGRFYRWCYGHNLLVGSGVNMIGTRVTSGSGQSPA